MKSFIAAIIIVSAVIVLITANAFATAHVTDELLSYIELYEQDQSSDYYNAFLNKWESTSTYLALTVSRGHLYSVNEGIELISRSSKEKDASGVYYGVSKIKQALVEIEDFSSFDFTDIL